MNVVESHTETVTVTMQWEADVVIETTEGNGVRCEGWLEPQSVAVALEHCRTSECRILTIERQSK